MDNLLIDTFVTTLNDLIVLKCRFSHGSHSPFPNNGADFSKHYNKGRGPFKSEFNQLDFYSTNIPGKARLSDTVAKSVFDSKIDEAVP